MQNINNNLGNTPSGSRLQTMMRQQQQLQSNNNTGNASNNPNNNGGGNGEVLASNEIHHIKQLLSTGLQSNYSSEQYSMITQHNTVNIPLTTQQCEKCWNSTHLNLQNKHVLQLLSQCFNELLDVFNTISYPVNIPNYQQPINVVKCGSGSGTLIQLLDEYGVIPAYVSKKEVKVLFDMVMCAQVSF